MSIILKGIDMPKDIDELRLIINGMSIAIEPTQAIQIPTPHGRLIDIDKVKDELRDQIPCCGLDMTYSNSNAFDAMDNAPTILEEEK